MSLAIWGGGRRRGGYVADYAAILEETHILARVRPFAGGRRAELTSMPKVYFIDNGLRNHLAGGFEPLERRTDVGKLMENLVFGELHKRWPWPGELRFWRSKNGAEVDFVLEPEPGRLIAVEVKAGASPRRRISRGARSFLTACSPAELVVVHRGEGAEEQVEGTRVRWLPIEELPEWLDGLG